MLDAANQALIKEMAASGMNISDIPVEEYRAATAARLARAPAGPEIGSVADFTLSGRDGPIPVRLFKPVDAPRALILYAHGGGWTVGSTAGSDPVLRRLVVESSAIILSVDYRLAPEHPFPAGIEDMWDALLWTAANAEGIGAAGLPLIVMGDSAGANFSAALTLMTRDRGGPAIAGQILLYPMVDGDLNEPHLDELEPPRLGKSDIAWYLKGYVPDPAHWRDPRFSTTDAGDFSGLPPAFVATAEADILRGQAEEYGLKLLRAGVPVWMRRYLGTFHGFFSFSDAITQSGMVMTDICRFIAHGLDWAEAKKPSGKD